MNNFQFYFNDNFHLYQRSSLSNHDDSTHFFDSVDIRPYHPSLLAAFSISTELMYISICWSANTGIYVRILLNKTCGHGKRSKNKLISDVLFIDYF